MTTDVLTSRDQVAAIAEEWDALLAGTACNRAFGSSAWYRAAAEKAGTPLVVIARDRGALTGVLPLFVEEGEREASFITRLSDYNDAVVRANDTAIAARLLRTACEAAPSLLLREVRNDATLAAALGDFAVEPLPSGPRAVFTPLSGWNDWLRARSRAFRKSLFRAQRAAAAAGLRVRELDDADAPAALFVALHGQRRETSCFADAANRAFLERALPPLLRERRMRAFGVLAGDDVIAIDLCVTGPNALATWNAGFRSDYAHFSPGTLMLAEEVRAACEEGACEYDLLRGDEGYKTSWAPLRRELARLRVHTRRDT